MKLVLVGFGAVGKTILEMLPLTKLVPRENYQKLLIIEPKSLDGPSWLLEGIDWQHIRVALTPKNMVSILEPHLQSGDMLLDCSVDVDALQIMAICERVGANYINSSMEDWATAHPEHLDTSKKALFKRSLYARILEAREKFKNAKMSMLVDQGQNPGSVSLFALKALREKARAMNATAALEDIEKRNFASAAQKLELRLIHITEYDSQVTKSPKENSSTFYNTWSCVGLIAESLDPAQIGFGTHEAPLANAFEPLVGPRNVRILPVRGMDLLQWSLSPQRDSFEAKSKSPFHKYMGFAIPHGEANTISQCLSLPGYRPTVSFVYRPCAVARSGLRRMRKQGYVPPQDTHVLNLTEIESGCDAIGALLVFADGSYVWSGTLLNVRDMQGLGIRFAGPTTVQVGIAMLSAWHWMLENPHKGFLTPEDLPFEEILDMAIPFLGPCPTLFSPPHETISRVPRFSFLPTHFTDYVYSPGHVIIVGAGFSGLYAAYLLQKLGHRVTILEQRDRPGGKGRTMSTTHGIFELGPSVFHTHQIHMMHLAKAFSLPVTKLRNCVPSVPVFRKDKDLQKNAQVQDVLDIGQMRDGNEIAHMQYDAWHKGYEAESEAELCTFAHGWQDAAAQIARGLQAKGVKIVYNHKVQALGRQKDKLVLRNHENKDTNKDTTHSADAVILATSLEHFKALKLDDSIVLAPNFEAALKSAHSEPTLRVYVEFRQAVLKDFPSDVFRPDSLFRWCLKMNDFILLLSYTDGEEARKRSHINHHEFVDRCLQELNLPRLKDISRFHFANWKTAFTVLGDPLSPQVVCDMHKVSDEAPVYQTFLPDPTQQAWTEGQMIAAAHCAQELCGLQCQ